MAFLDEDDLPTGPPRVPTTSVISDEELARMLRHAHAAGRRAGLEEAAKLMEGYTFCATDYAAAAIRELAAK